MRAAVRIGRRAAIKPAAAASLPPSETILVDSGAPYLSPVGTASAVTAVGDGSDSTYIEGDDFYVAMEGSTFANLAQAGGRGIASFVVQVRASGDELWVAAVESFTGLTPTQSQFVSGALPAAGFGDRTLGPITKSGGGNFTATEIDAMSCTANCFSTSGGVSMGRIARIALVVTYAT